MHHHLEKSALDKFILIVVLMRRAEHWKKKIKINRKSSFCRVSGLVQRSLNPILPSDDRLCPIRQVQPEPCWSYSSDLVS